MTNQYTRFKNFTEKLALLSAEYGVAIQSIGGVHIFDDPAEASGIVYSQDHTGGDLEYKLPVPK